MISATFSIVRWEVNVNYLQLMIRGCSYPVACFDLTIYIRCTYPGVRAKKESELVLNTLFPARPSGVIPIG